MGQHHVGERRAKLHWKLAAPALAEEAFARIAEPNVSYDHDSEAPCLLRRRHKLGDQC